MDEPTPKFEPPREEPQRGQPDRRGPRRPRRGGRGRGGPGGFIESPQSRDVARYEQRQQRQQQRPGWRPPAWRRDGRSQQQYQQQVRRVTGARPPMPQTEGPVEPIAGPHAVLEALRSGRFLKTLYVAEERSLRSGPVQELLNEAQARRLRVNFIDKLDLARLSPIENHQGVVGIFEGRVGVDLEELLLHLDVVREPALVLVLDSLQDPQNFGVLLRTAETAGAHGVIMPRHRAVGVTAAVAKTSAGASEHLLIADVANLRQAIDELKRKGIWVVGTAEDGDLYYDEVDYRGPVGIVVGNEAEGIRRLVREGCDQVVRLPVKGKIGSLNAAAAGSVVLYEALRQRIRDAAPAARRPIEGVSPSPQPTEDAAAAEGMDAASDEALAAPAREQSIEEPSAGRPEEPEE
jgi:23S rRNA (guanosine2251-2'-O)-methyltransferase